MDFSRRKLPKEAADKMKICPIDSVQPYALMLAPVYAFMKLNEKFVSVKAPLDFFTPGELEKLRTFEAFYFPEFIDSVLPFREAARSIRSLLEWTPDLCVKGKRKDLVALPPASYELSDAVLRILGPLWSGEVRVEPFFVAVLVGELCELLPSKLLTEARDRSVELYENAVLGSSWAVFLALHLGYTDLGFLNGLRVQVFTELSQDRVPQSDFNPLAELLRNAGSTLVKNTTSGVAATLFGEFDDRVSQKVAGRLKRISTELVHEGSEAPTIFGERGFVDV